MTVEDMARVVDAAIDGCGDSYYWGSIVRNLREVFPDLDWPAVADACEYPHAGREVRAVLGGSEAK